MKESIFQFDNPYISSIEFHENEDYVFSSENEINVKMVKNISDFESEDRAVVSLQIKIGYCENCPFDISVTMSSMFYWTGLDDLEQIGYFLNNNAISLLISYIRPVISNLTALSKFPTLNLPFFDLTQMVDEQEK